MSSVCTCVDEDDVVIAETTTFYKAIAFTIWYTWVSWVNQLILEAPLCFICIGYNWKLWDLSGEAEKRSNCEMCSNIMHEYE